MDEEYIAIKSMLDEFNVGRNVVKKLTEKLMERGIEDQELLTKLLIDILWTREEIINGLSEGPRKFSYDELIDLTIKRYEDEYYIDNESQDMDETSMKF